jgi:hypothetical protein
MKVRRIAEIGKESTTVILSSSMCLNTAVVAVLRAPPWKARDTCSLLQAFGVLGVAVIINLRIYIGD